MVSSPYQVNKPLNTYAPKNVIEIKDYNTTQKMASINWYTWNTKKGQKNCFTVFVDWKFHDKKKIWKCAAQVLNNVCLTCSFFCFRCTKQKIWLFFSLGIHNQLSTCGLLYDLWSCYHLRFLLLWLPMGVYLCKCGGWMIKIND